MAWSHCTWWQRQPKPPPPPWDQHPSQLGGDRSSRWHGRCDRIDRATPACSGQLPLQCQMLMDTRSLVICSHGGRGGEFAGGSQGLQIERSDIFERRSASSAIDSPDLTPWNRGATDGAYADRPASPAPSSASSESRTAALVSRWNGVEAGQEPIHTSLVNRWNGGGSSHGHEHQRYSYRGTP
eukprot:COSAG06_NODE_28956_length_565_cov_0.667382_1_plen_182_part_01